jgi:hypothetical protein
MVRVSPFGELDVVDGFGQWDAPGLGEQQHQAAGDERQGSCGETAREATLSAGAAGSFTVIKLTLGHAHLHI